MEKENIKPIVFEIEYGKIIVKLDEIMKKLNVSNYELNSKANIKFQTIQNLRINKSSRIDFEVLAKLCYSLNCKVEDILEYVPNSTINQLQKSQKFNSNFFNMNIVID